MYTRRLGSGSPPRGPNAPFARMEHPSVPLKAGMQPHRGRHAACPSQADVADGGGRKREQMQTTARCAGAAFAALRSNAAECSFGVLPASGAARDSFFRGQLDPK